MGATVSISAENLLSFAPTELLTNDRGRFSTATLAPGMYSVKVTLAGFFAGDSTTHSGKRSADDAARNRAWIGAFFVREATKTTSRTVGFRRMDLGPSQFVGHTVDLALAGRHRDRRGNSDSR